MAYYIESVHMDPSDSGDHEHIAEVQWVESFKGQVGYSTRQQMVDLITKGGDVRVKDGEGEVAVTYVSGNPPYIRTHADGRETDNLLSLPRY